MCVCVRVCRCDRCRACTCGVERVRVFLCDFNICLCFNNNIATSHIMDLFE